VFPAPDLVNYVLQDSQNMIFHVDFKEKSEIRAFKLCFVEIGNSRCWKCSKVMSEEDLLLIFGDKVIIEAKEKIEQLFQSKSCCACKKSNIHLIKAKCDHYFCQNCYNLALKKFKCTCPECGRKGQISIIENSKEGSRSHTLLRKKLLQGIS
jgi:hypothetical protein